MSFRFPHGDGLILLRSAPPLRFEDLLRRMNFPESSPCVDLAPTAN